MRWYRRDWRSKVNLILIWAVLGALTVLSVWVLLYLFDTIGTKT